jgi:hypothetical protein
MDARNRIQAKLAALNFDFRRFTMESFVAQIEAQLKRRIYFIGWQMPPGFFGVWLSDAEKPLEYIFYDQSAPPLHQVHIQLHELAHVLCGHTTVKLTGQDIARLLQGKLDWSQLNQALRRSVDQVVEDEEAEVMATLIQEQVIRHSHLEQLTVAISSDESVATYIRTMRMV